MDKCYICREARPCCGGLVHMMREEKHRGHTIEVPDLKKTWGLGRVFQNCRGFEGEYEDEWTGTLKLAFLGRTREEAVKRMNHVKSFY